MSLLLWALKAVAAFPKLAEFIHEIIDAIIREQRKSDHARNRDAIDAWLRDDVDTVPAGGGEGAQLSGSAKTVRGQTVAPDQ